MIVAFDVGNTNINIGVFGSDSKIIKQWRVKTDHDKTADEYGVLLHHLLEYNDISAKSMEGIIVSSVVPEVMFNLTAGIRKYLGLEPTIVSDKLNLNIKIKYDDPKTLGADRICNAVAAYNVYGGPIVIVDVGTTTTFCAVNSQGEILGESILPGPQALIEGMYAKTSSLPKIGLNKPTKVIGTNIVDAMTSGLMYGYAGAVDGVIRSMKQEMCEENVTVIGTGGLMSFIIDEVELINEIYDYLTLEGLRIIFEMNK